MTDTSSWSDARWYDEDLQAIAGVERLRFFPQVTVSGHGSRLTTADGREVWDLSAAWTTMGFGNGNPEVAEAVSRAITQSAGASVLSGTHPEAVLLARELLDLVRTVGDDRRVYLGHAGTDANDVAVRAVRHATGRPQVLAFEHGYHGGLGTAMAVSGLHVAAGATPDPEVVFVPYPDPYRPWTGDADTLLASTLELVETHLSGGEVAGVLVEPIQSDGGVVVPPRGFLAGLRGLCDKYGSLLILDEVKVGLGRTGATFAHEHEGITPDLVTLGKALGGGVPLSAVVGPASALDSPTASALMTTIGNAVSCAAGRAVVGLVRDGRWTRAAAERGEQLVSAWEAYRASGRPGAARVGDVRGLGLACGVELVRPGTREPDADLTAKTLYRGWHLGVIAYPVRDNVIELTPPLVIGADELDTALALLMQALDDAVGGVVTDEDVAAFSGW